MELDVGVEVNDARSPAQIIGERLARLADGAARTARDYAAEDITDAEVVTDELPAAASPEAKVIEKSDAAASAAEPTDYEDGEAVSTDDITDDELKEFEDDTNG